MTESDIKAIANAVIIAWGQTFGVPPAEHHDHHTWIRKSIEDEKTDTKISKEAQSQLKLAIVERIGWAILVLAMFGYSQMRGH